MMIINKGDPVIIFGGPNRVFFVKIPDDCDEIPNAQNEANKGNNRLIHDRNGIFDIAKCIGRSYGEKLFWDPKNRSSWVVLLKPTPELITKSITHHTQILYRADVSLIILLLNLLPGKRVVECGTGSGSTSYSLANAVMPNGHVYTFDFHEKRREYARELFNKANISHVISVHDADAYVPNAFLIEDDPNGNNIKRGSIDAVFLDLPSPWATIDNCITILKHFGRLVNFSPCIEQAQRISQVLNDKNFADVRTFEILCKPWGLSFDDDEGEGGGGGGSGGEGVGECEGEEGDGNNFNNTILNTLSYVNYQLPQLNHTGYITVATANFIDQLVDV